MKNRRIVIVAFMLVAVLCLGVGYAAVSDTLTATGKISVNETALTETFDADVYFVESVKNPVGVGLDGVDLTAEANVKLEITDDDDTFTVTIADTVFSDENQKVTVYVMVKNASATTPVNVTLKTTDLGALATNFAIAIAPNGDTQIDANGEQEYAISIELTSIPEEAINEGTFTFTLEATPVNA
jgi:hypothetical protein